MKAEIIEKWQCPSCDKWYADDDDDDDDLPNFASDGQEAAEKCCTEEIESQYFCSVCDEKFWRYKDAEAHLKTPHVGIDPSPEEIYLDNLRFTNRPVYELQTEYIHAMAEVEK